MPRKPKPDAFPYLRLIMGIPMDRKILTVDQQNRLEIAGALIKFLAFSTPKKPEMAAFLKGLSQENGVSRSFCYKVKRLLENLSLVKWDDYWCEYRLNMERWKRDKRALEAFNIQVDAWEKGKN